MLIGVAFEVNIHTGFQRHHAGILVVGGAVVSLGYALDALKVGINSPCESPLVAQHVGEQPLVAGAGHTVNRVVGCHDCCHAGFHGTLELRGVFAEQSAFANVGTFAVQAAFGYAIGSKVFQGRIYVTAVGDVIALHAPHHLGGKHAGEIGVFAKGLLHAAPARFASDVDNRTVAHVGALQTSLEGNHFAHAMHQLLVECAGLRQGGGHHGGAYCHVSVRTFFGNEDGNSQTGVIHCIALNLVEGFGSQARIQACDEGLLGPGVGAQHSPQRAQRLGIHALLEQRRDVNLVAFFLIHRPTERTQQLTHLFVQGHLRQQDFDTLLNGQRCIAVAGVDCRLGLRFFCSLALLLGSIHRHCQHSHKSQQ